MSHPKYPTPDFDIKLSGARVLQARRLLGDLGALRHRTDYNQQHFWRKYGITQSGGSRYEKNGHQTPTPVRMLLLLEAMGYVSEQQMIEVLRLVERAGATGDRD